MATSGANMDQPTEMKIDVYEESAVIFKLSDPKLLKNKS